MQDEQDGGAGDTRDPEPQTRERAAWVGAAGVSGEHVLDAERPPRLHWMLMVLGPLGLAIAIVASLWSSARHVERSVNVQVETRWVAGEQLAIRTQIIGADLKPLAEEVAVSLAYVDAVGTAHELGALTTVAPGLSQGALSVPELEPGAGALVLHYEPGAGSRLEPFEERVEIELVRERGADEGRQVVSENMLQWADDTDEQPEGARIDVRPAGRLLAGFDNRVFVRVTDPAGKPWKPAAGPARIQVLLVSGEFDNELGAPDKPSLLYDGELDALGLASVSGVLSSDTIRFEVRLVGEAELPTPESPTPESPTPESPPQPAADPPKSPDPYLSGPKRKLRFVSHAGTVRVHASTDFAHPGDEIEITVDAISTRRPAFVDVHGPGGAWLDTLTPPLVVPQQRKWTVPAAALGAGEHAGPFVQFEAYQSTLRPEDSSAIARVQIASAGSARADSLVPLIERQREQLALPRIDREFEIGRERTYLSHIEAQHRAKALSDAEVERARAFLIGSLEAVVHGPPQALNTRAREDATLARFKRRWTMGIRWFLLGGGGLFIFVMSTMVWRNQRKLEAQTTHALGLVEGSTSEIDDEAFADQSLAILRSRREIVVRGVLTIALMVAALLLTVAMLESMVWEY